MAWGHWCVGSRTRCSTGLGQEEAGGRRQPPAQRSHRAPSISQASPAFFFFLFSLYIICCRNYSYLQMNDLVPLLAWLRFHPSRRKLPANPAALAQTRALSMRSWQQRVTPEPTAPGAATCQESFLSSP